MFLHKSSNPLQTKKTTCHRPIPAIILQLASVKCPHTAGTQKCISPTTRCPGLQQRIAFRSKDSKSEKKILNTPQEDSLFSVLAAYILYVISILKVYIYLTIVIRCLLIHMSSTHVNVFIIPTVHMNEQIAVV